MNRIKYWLLCKLLGDICIKTDDCRTCEMRTAGKRECTQACTHGQARKVWGIK